MLREFNLLQVSPAYQKEYRSNSLEVLNSILYREYEEKKPRYFDDVMDFAYSYDVYKKTGVTFLELLRMDPIVFDEFRLKYFRKLKAEEESEANKALANAHKELTKAVATTTAKRTATQGSRSGPTYAG